MNFLLNFSFGPRFEISHMILAKNLEIQDFNYKKKIRIRKCAEISSKISIIKFIINGYKLFTEVKIIYLLRAESLIDGLKNLKSFQ
jgi:hypothetical protein